MPSRTWRRLTFLYTTGEKLLAATEINDLIVQSPERERLWQALRERGLAAERQYQRAGGGEIDLALLCALGQLGIAFGEPQAATSPPERERGWQYLAVSAAEVNQALPAVVERIASAVDRLGGLAPTGRSADADAASA